MPILATQPDRYRPHRSALLLYCWAGALQDCTIHTSDTCTGAWFFGGGCLSHAAGLMRGLPCRPVTLSVLSPAMARPPQADTMLLL